jgi:uncharacterized damage-inducible protein DinB
MSDIFLVQAQVAFDRSVNDIRECIAGLDVGALNWRPAGDETNSIAVLAVHALASTRSWLSVAVGAPRPERDRDAEFRAVAEGADALLAHIDTMAAASRALLRDRDGIDWSALRTTHARPSPDLPTEVPGAWALLHALEHLREHTGQMFLTRQLYEGAASS